MLHVFPTFVAGGAQVRTTRLMVAMGDAFRHSVVALDGETSATELVDASVELDTIAPPPKAGSLATIRRLAALLRRERPNLLCTYNWGAIDAVIAARWSGLRSVLHHEDGFGADEADGFKRRRIWTRRIVLRGTAGLIVPSHVLEALALERWRIPAALVHRIPNGIHVGHFERADGNIELRERLGVPSGAFVVGSVGHLRAEKNPVRAVEAFAAMRAPDAARPAYLFVLGDGPERAAVEAKAHSLGVHERVRLVGHRTELAPYYRAMDAFVISSNTEQMPVALLEAMAAELPVAATDVGDVRRILPPEQADLVTAVDARALAEALSRLYADPTHARALGAANRTRARETYSFDAMVAAHRARFETALAR